MYFCILINTTEALQWTRLGTTLQTGILLEKGHTHKVLCFLH